MFFWMFNREQIVPAKIQNYNLILQAIDKSSFAVKKQNSNFQDYIINVRVQVQSIIIIIFNWISSNMLFNITMSTSIHEPGYKSWQIVKTSL